jgi:hypothetical protein
MRGKGRGHAADLPFRARVGASTSASRAQKSRRSMERGSPGTSKVGAFSSKLGNAPIGVHTLESIFGKQTRFVRDYKVRAHSVWAHKQIRSGHFLHPPAQAAHV